MNAGRDDEELQSPEDSRNDLDAAARDEDGPPPVPPPSPTRRYPDDVSDDDRDTGWGEQPQGSYRGDDWYLRERPPHHG